MTPSEKEKIAGGAGMPLGSLLIQIHRGEMSMAQASHYGHSYYSIESAMDALNQIESETIERCAKLIEVQHLDEKYWTLPSHPKSESLFIDKIIGSVIRDRAVAIRALSKKGEGN